MASTWRKLVRQEILRLTKGRPGAIFTRQDLWAHSGGVFTQVFPAGKTPDYTMSRVLQELRDLGFIEFMLRGEYKVLVESEAEATRHEALMGRPDARPGVMKVTTGLTRTRPYQRWLRRHVLPNFGHACAVCGLTPEWFLDAAHLRPAGSFIGLAGDPLAAVALCKNHHTAMDIGALTIESDLRISIEKPRNRSAELQRVLFEYEGKSIRRPKRWNLRSDALPSLPVRRRAKR